MAPLTILVGENSAGKSSFLALVRALWNLYNNYRVPDFNEDPFDFGTFDNIIFSGHGKKKINKTFEAGLRFDHQTQNSNDRSTIWFEVEFGKKGTAPFPIKLSVSNSEENLDLTLSASGDNLVQVNIQTKRDSWKSKAIPNPIKLFDSNQVTAISRVLKNMKPSNLTQAHGITLGSIHEIWDQQGIEYTSVSNNGSARINEDDWNQIEDLLYIAYPSDLFYLNDKRSPYASSPVRSKPLRIYQPKLFSWDSEGNFTPMYLADLFETKRDKWDTLKPKLEKFGSQSGLFDKISIYKLEEHDGGSFRVEIHKFGKQIKSKSRNLIDVGYGVSQILPVLTELLRYDSAPLLLLQQPEVHLHPSAQAALGSLLLQTARKEQIVIVESHSDHLLNRIRMDLRDGVGNRKPEDVSILYFENSDLSSRIHSLRIDEQGNVLDAPESYGRFFMDETKRSLKL